MSEEGSLSELPEGEEVDLGADIDEDSWYDFNKEISLVGNKSQSVNRSQSSV